MADLLIDTDSFCKLGAADLLEAAASCFGATLDSCKRLYALPYMLSRGGLVSTYGTATCQRLSGLAGRVPSIPQLSDTSLDKYIEIDDLDIGEAQLYEFAARTDALILTSDKRSILALHDLPDVLTRLHDRIVPLEAVLISLGNQLGFETLRQRIAEISDMDRIISICFSPSNHDIEGCLMSYLRDLARRAQPLRLHMPK